jgi:SAM-dependent methyltransferase
MKSRGCDYNPDHAKLGELEVPHVDMSLDRIPFDDATFDLVTCTEVVEHLENFRHALREAARVTKPGGLIVVSTPNILTLRSRLSFLSRGFYTFFDPLPLKDDPAIYPGQRHITPITFFHLAHALLDSGFGEIKPHYDKPQKFSSFWGALLAPFFRLSALRSQRRRARRYGLWSEVIEELALENNAWEVLTGRTLIVTARRSHKKVA